MSRGKFVNVRIPKELNKKLKKIAIDNDVQLYRLVTGLLEEAISREGFLQDVLKKIKQT